MRRTEYSPRIHRGTARIATFSGLAAWALAGLAACGIIGPVNPSAPAQSSGSAQSSGPAPSTSPAPLADWCPGDIQVVAGDGQGAAGHYALVLVFTNTSSATCTLVGYPGVTLVNAAGDKVSELTQTLRGMAGGVAPGVTEPQPVVLAPGESASALAEASTVPSDNGGPCGAYKLKITVPNRTLAQSGGSATLPGCAAEIHPVVPGLTGGGAG